MSHLNTKFPKNILLQDQLQNGSVSGGARDEETCLEVSRLLRRAERWIRETQRNFERTRCEIMDDEPRRLSGAEVMRSNWLNVGRMLQERSDRLIHRIDRLIKEFEDLRQLVRCPPPFARNKCSTTQSASQRSLPPGSFPKYAN